MGQTRTAFVSVLLAVAEAVLLAPAAHADNDNDTVIPNNKRFNDGVVANVYTMQHQAGCSNDVNINPQLQLAAQRHTEDLLHNRNLDGDIGSDGSTPQDRANAAGFHGPVSETVGINPALAMSNNELINRWYGQPDYFAIMSNCTNSQVGVWSENSLDRTVVVAVYGPAQGPSDSTPRSLAPAEPAPRYAPPGRGFDPSPDYDASDELEFGIRWLPWILRGVYPPPASPPN